VTSPPLVTFVVPCFKLAHLLGDCVRSILDQTYPHVEILIMDDCSPDATGEVAASFADPRVRYVRHPQNLGHLRNYNAGISMAQGRYVWLISADDRLRRPYVLERFVDALEKNPAAAYVFCPAMRVNEGGDAGAYGSIGPDDRVIPGLQFVDTLISGNTVPAPAAMARRSAYELVGHFPLDMPFAGDWFMWTAFAAWGDVVYLAEPMVDYRIHPLNLTKEYLDRAPALVQDELAVRWRILDLAYRSGNGGLRLRAEQSIARDYARRVGWHVTQESPFGLSVEAFEASIDRPAASDRLRAAIRSAAYAALGDGYFEIGDPARARAAYARALAARPAALRTIAKAILVSTGRPGLRLREALTARREARSRQRGAQSAENMAVAMRG
jgi:glycosyltransferase involved in cell wall biosynthesis